MSKKLIFFCFFLVFGFLALFFGLYFKEDIKIFVKEHLYVETYNLEYSEYVKEASIEFDVPESMIYAIIKTESNFQHDVVSHAGAVGLTQLLPETYSWVAMKLGENPDMNNISDPKTNIRYGTYYLAFLSERLENDETVYAAYNAGFSRVTGWLSDSRYSDDGKILSKIPYKETKAYVDKVKKARGKYEEIIKKVPASSQIS